ncbi:hypothetical protein F7725_019458 [Dissostichus mawsoni]|uniref:G-protein coupled receptors family 1 profile domain-containing protein n=1 Tax=Dissostichus mawsoni TaxID=36200 RepID=A0A7J5YLV5_DISMA|nr:hypothetical protein F7725_019458 [Dissostichus mawsoni]
MFVFFICFLLGVPGNIAVIILKPNWQYLSSLSQSLMLNLAISDLICLLLRPPSQLVAVLLKECLIGFFSISVVAFSYMGLHRKVNHAAFFNNPQTGHKMPFYITNVLGLAALSLKNEALLKFCWNIWNLVTALVVVNSCLNPLLYAFAVCRKRENE